MAFGHDRSSCGRYIPSVHATGGDPFPSPLQLNARKLRVLGSKDTALFRMRPKIFDEGNNAVTACTEKGLSSCAKRGLPAFRRKSPPQKPSHS
ncbi:MAG: hypothetical protein DUD31_03365 [Coriobacteriaceae bacterium]|nr:MAG: hypothetical protein DUD31_03365 [Coriobacteriaceae bacterium]